jgi:hypothetical protein
MASDDRREMYVYYHHLEPQQRIKPGDIKIDLVLRDRTVDWMYEVCEYIVMPNDTLDVFVTAVGIFDHFLTYESQSTETFDKIGAACISIAIKYEDDQSYQDLISTLADTIVSKKEIIIKWEWIILQRLNFNIRFITPYHFLDYFISNLEFDPRSKTSINYIIDLMTTKSYMILNYSPSMISASAIYLTRMLSAQKPVWTEEAQQNTAYTEADLRQCVKSIVQILRKESQQRDGSGGIVSQRYKLDQFYRISNTILRYYQTH